MIFGFTTDTEKDFIEAFNRLCNLAEQNFNIEISRILYTKKSPVEGLKFNQIMTRNGGVWFETDKAYKRRIYSTLTDSIQKTILEEIK